MKQFHHLQLKILKDLLFARELRFSELKPLEMEGSQFMFHMQKLIGSRLVCKTKTGYVLSDEGKEYANRLSEEDVVLMQQTKVTTVLCAIKELKGSRQFLIYRRSKNPFFDCSGFPTRKVRWGENLKDAAICGFSEEMNLTGEPTLFAIRHYKVFKNRVLVEDKLMHAFFIVNPKGIMECSFQGVYEWVNEEDLKEKIARPLEEFWEIYSSLKKFDGNITFEEYSIESNNF